MSLLLTLVLPALAIDPKLLEQIRAGMHSENPNTTPAVATADPGTNGMSVETVAKLKRATVLLKVPNGEGSGFFIEDELVMTNRHVVEGLPVGTAIDVVLDSGTREGTHVTGYVAHASTDVDLALILVPGATGRKLELVPSLSGLRETEPVVAVGFPMGHIRSFGGADADPPVSLRPGAITALHQSRGGELQLIEHNTNMQQGNSGGPLVDEKGAVIGINEAMLEADTTTKIAIPSTTALAYLAKVGDSYANAQTATSQSGAHPSQTSSAPAAPARRGGLGLGGSGGSSAPPPPPPAPTVPVIRTEIARPFEEHLVSEIGIGPDGNSYVLLTNGKVLLLKNETEWVDIHSGSNNADISVDDKKGTLWVVESDTGHVVRYAGNQKWDLVGDGQNAQVAASDGKIWTITKDGTVMRYDGSGWVDLQLTGTEEVVACDGVAYLRSGTSIWAHDGTNLANDGKALITGVKEMVCYQERAYGLMSDYTIVDLMAGKTIDSSTNNTTIFPTPKGLLALTKDGSLWYFDSTDGSWSKVQTPDT